MTRATTARAAAYTSWARTRDRSVRTEPGRAGLEARFEREARAQLGPGATDRQVADAAAAARSAYFQKLSAAGSAARWGGRR